MTNGEQRQARCPNAEQRNSSPAMCSSGCSVVLSKLPMTPPEANTRYRQR